MSEIIPGVSQKEVIKQIMLEIVFPNKNDYLHNLDIRRIKNKKEKLDILEASGNAYFSRGLTSYLFKERLIQIAKKIPPKKYISSLDAGTGVGIFLPFLSSISRHVDAIDCSDILKYTKSMINSRGINNVDLYKTNLLNLGDGKKYDIVVCLSVLEHISERDLPRAVEIFKRVLPDDGLLIAGFPVEKRHIYILKKVFQLTRPKSLLLSFKMKYFDNAHSGHVSNYKMISSILEKNFQVYGKIEFKFLSFTLYKTFFLGKKKLPK